MSIEEEALLKLFEDKGKELQKARIEAEAMKEKFRRHSQGPYAVASLHSLSLVEAEFQNNMNQQFVTSLIEARKMNNIIFQWIECARAEKGENAGDVTSACGRIPIC